MKRTHKIIHRTGQGETQYEIGVGLGAPLEGKPRAYIMVGREMAAVGMERPRIMPEAILMEIIRRGDNPDRYFYGGWPVRQGALEAWNAAIDEHERDRDEYVKPTALEELEELIDEVESARIGLAALKNRLEWELNERNGEK